MDIAKKIKVINHFDWYYRNHYITTRDGNACFRKEDGNFMITASGVSKSELDRESFVTVDSDCNLISQEHPDSKPSIETKAHIDALTITGKQASVHVHSPNTVALFSLFEARMQDIKYVSLMQVGNQPPAVSSVNLQLVPEVRNLERAIRENWPEFFRYTQLGYTIPYLPPGSEALHNSIKSSFTDLKNTDIIVLDRHGVLAVGDTLDQCREHIERLDHTCLMILKMLSATGGNKELVIYGKS